MAKERIDKLISSQSMITRSDVARLVKSGSVKINGKSIKTASEKADPVQDIIEIDSKRFVYKKNIYIMMNKPDGVVSASRDPKEKTVIDLLPQELMRPGLFPAGRLDKDTTGFVLITDDGDFAHNILSPKRHIDKTYLAETDSEIDEAFLVQMRNGMTVGEEKLLPAQIERLNSEKDKIIYKIILHEGKYHQIKRMIAASETVLLSLKRIKMGGLPLDEKLLPGEARELSEKEVELIVS